MAASPSALPGATAPLRAAIPALEISYFTDPLCCWSWGFEPQLRRLRYAFAGRIALRLRMGGMIGDWNGFSDPLNDIHRPAQMGPLWIQAGTITGMAAEPTVWVHDAPASSWPSCLAVKAAGLQLPAAADLYLRRVREAVMIQGRNVARHDVLIDIAQSLAQERPDLIDAELFERDFAGREARTALEEDVREARFRGVRRFPCLGLSRSGAEPVWLVGWRPWEALVAAVRDCAPNLGAERKPANPDAYALYWAGVLEPEVAVAFGRSQQAISAGSVHTPSSGTSGEPVQGSADLHRQASNEKS
ncbi:DsbA family protein [Mesorhizobium sp. BAC0120]|uniref:DsbA family protein n=1 Tax=Mesorhizobium sp. BAC0120 TaxID=3090670 RepID=UPI00298D524A|nr:DsbA family protein [Mesorhizobium sp. BAC0120]MDW6021543.1 DsbA family protein [Mesorhizobium sp. BAC0120]